MNSLPIKDTRNKKIKRKLKKSSCILALSILFLSCVLIIGIFTNEAEAAQDNDAQSFNMIVIKHGDTLWQLVEDNYNYQGDIRKAIYEVKQINGLENSAIYPGQIIYIPIE